VQLVLDGTLEDSRVDWLCSIGAGETRHVPTTCR
jgi:hypothetical protein